MTRKFKVTIDVDDLYELTYTRVIREYDQREGEYTSTKTETKTFLSQEAAEDFLRKETEVKPTEFVRVTKLPLPSRTKKPDQSRPTTL